MKHKGNYLRKRRPELFLMVGGAGLLVVFFAANLWAQVERVDALEKFAQTRAPAAQIVKAENPAALAAPASDAPLASLRIRTVQIEVPGFEGTDESVLRRGAGYIEGTARPGTRGNVGIAAHRDRDFRPLQHVRIGDVVELETQSQIHAYRVIGLSIVEPADIHVLDGIKWARFEALFSRVNSDGTVSFNIRDRRNRVVEKVSFMPGRDQVAYISNRPVQFRNLTQDQPVNLYTPEGQYGFSTTVDDPVTALAAVVPYQPMADEPVDESIASVPAQRQQLLPATASSLPWIALTGVLMLIASFVLLVFRRG